MELIFEMDSPQNAPLMRELVKGPTRFIDKHNNQQKPCVHIPKCSNEAYAVSQIIKSQFLQEIVNILGAGAENCVDGFHKGALGLCRGMVELFRVDGVPTSKIYETVVQKLLKRWRLNLVQSMRLQLLRILMLVVPPLKKVQRKYFVF
jgi:hypothetical protein